MIPWLKIGLYAAVLAGLLGLYAAWTHHERDLGAARVEAADAKALAERRLQDAVQARKDVKTNEDAIHALQTENESLAALAAKPAPVVRLCRGQANSGPTPAPTGTAGGTIPATPAAGDVQPVPGGTDLGPDIGAGLQAAMIRADQLSAQVRALLEREAGLHSPSP